MMPFDAFFAEFGVSERSVFQVLAAGNERDRKYDVWKSVGMK
jgi:hypothetical protein